MITLPLTEGLINRAKRKCIDHTLNNSITNGENEWIGMAGEIAVYDYFSKDNDVTLGNGNIDFDLIINGYKVEVKTTKCSSEPKSNYKCNVSGYNPNQKCDFYFFVRVNTKGREVYLLGYLQRETFYRIATLCKEGSEDGDAGFKYRCDTYTVPINKLISKFKT